MCHFGSTMTPDGKVNSPDLKKAKNPRQQAAHNMMLSRFLGSQSNVVLILLRMYGVIGRRVSLALDLALFKPLKAKCSHKAAAKGSPKPCDTCQCRTPVRYDRIELGARWSNSRAVNRINTVSSAGSGHIQVGTELLVLFLPNAVRLMSARDQAVLNELCSHSCQAGDLHSGCRLVRKVHSCSEM